MAESSQNSNELSNEDVNHEELEGGHETMEEDHTDTHEELMDEVQQEIVQQVALQLKLLTETAEANGIKPEDLLMDPNLLKGLIPEDAPLTLAALKVIQEHHSNDDEESDTQHQNHELIQTEGEAEHDDNHHDDEDGQEDQSDSEMITIPKFDFSTLTAASADALAQALKPMLASAQLEMNQNEENDTVMDSEAPAQADIEKPTETEKETPAPPPPVQESGAITPSIPQAPVKRGRGRPRKNQTNQQLKTIKQKNDAANSSEDEKPRRGRPPKSMSKGKKKQSENTQSTLSAALSAILSLQAPSALPPPPPSSSSQATDSNVAKAPFSGLPIDQFASLFSNISAKKLEHLTSIEEENGMSTNSTFSKKGYAAKACIACKLSHVACDESRPCQRCIRNGKADTCQDAEQKRRGRPPKQQDKQAAAVNNATAIGDVIDSTPAPPLNPPSTETIKKRSIKGKRKINTPDSSPVLDNINRGVPSYLIPLKTALQKPDLASLIRSLSGASSFKKNASLPAKQSKPIVNSVSESSNHNPTSVTPAVSNSSTAEEENTATATSRVDSKVSAQDEIQSAMKDEDSNENGSAQSSSNVETKKSQESSQSANSPHEEKESSSPQIDNKDAVPEKETKRTYNKKPTVPRGPLPPVPTFRPLLPSIFPAADPTMYQKLLISALQGQLIDQKSDTEDQKIDEKQSERVEEKTVTDTNTDNEQKQHDERDPSNKDPSPGEVTQSTTSHLESTTDPEIAVKPKRRGRKPGSGKKTTIPAVIAEEKNEDMEESDTHMIEDEETLLQAVQALSELLPDLAAFTRSESMNDDTHASYEHESGHVPDKHTEHEQTLAIVNHDDSDIMKQQGEREGRGIKDQIENRLDEQDHDFDEKDATEQVRLLIEAVSQEQGQRHFSEEPRAETPQSGLSIEDLQALFDEPPPPPPPVRPPEVGGYEIISSEQLLRGRSINQEQSSLNQESEERNEDDVNMDISSAIQHLEQSNHLDLDDENSRSAVAAVMQALQAAQGDEAAAALLWDELAAVASAAGVLTHSSSHNLDHEPTAPQQSHEPRRRGRKRRRNDTDGETLSSRPSQRAMSST